MERADVVDEALENWKRNATPITGWLEPEKAGVSSEKVDEVPKIIGDPYKDAKLNALTNLDKRVLVDRFEKGVPILVKGVISARAAFEKKDYMAGSAALMDVCSGIAVLWSPPIGTAIGLVLNVIGQILNTCLVQEPSLEDKIEKLLDHFQSEQQYNNIAAVAHSISSYTTSLRTKSLRVADILAIPLTSETEAKDFIDKMEQLEWGLESDHIKLNVPAFAIWQVAAYLERPGNWRKEGWPEVLSIWCRTYIDLLTANMMLNCLADPKTLDTLILKTQNKESLPNVPEDLKQKCNKALTNLKKLTNMLIDSWKSDKKEMLKIVQAIRPAAQERGTYAHVGYYSNGLALYIASGTGSKEVLKWVYKNDTPWQNTISIHIPNAEKGSFAPKYEVFTCEYDNKIGHHMLDAVTSTFPLSKRTELIKPGPDEKFLDVSAMTSIGPLSGISGTSHNDRNKPIDSGEPAKAYVTVAVKKENFRGNYLSFYAINKDNKSKRVYREGMNSLQPYVNGTEDKNMQNVRSLYLPPTTLPDDPDADMVYKNSVGSYWGPELLAQNQNRFLTYAGLRDANKIGVGSIQLDTSLYAWSTVEGPDSWISYNGIEVDPYYLWVFGKGGIACATHASIIKCMQGTIARPSWIYHDFDTKIYDKDGKEYFIIDEHYFPAIKYLKDRGGPEVTSLCPCIEGTLVANIEGNIYTADYEIKRKSHHIVTSSWVKRGGNAKQVIKMPIPCWPMLESLRANLQSG